MAMHLHYRMPQNLPRPHRNLSSFKSLFLSTSKLMFIFLNAILTSTRHENVGNFMKFFNGSIIPYRDLKVCRR